MSSARKVKSSFSLVGPKQQQVRSRGGSHLGNLTRRGLRKREGGGRTVAANALQTHLSSSSSSEPQPAASNSTKPQPAASSTAAASLAAAASSSLGNQGHKEEKGCLLTRCSFFIPGPGSQPDDSSLLTTVVFRNWMVRMMTRGRPVNLP